MPTRLLGGIGGLAALALVVFGATSGSATTIGPNFCLSGSTATDCKMQLDLINPGSNPASASGPYVNIDVTIVNGSELQFSLDANTLNVNGTNYEYGLDNVALDLGLSAANKGTYTGSFVSATDMNDNAVASGQFSFGGSIVEDGFGSHSPGNKFGDVSISRSGSNGSTNALDSLVFDITWSTLPTGITSYTNLLTQQFMYLGDDGNSCQGNGCSAAAHVYEFTVPTEGNDVSTGFTGFAAWPNCADQNLTTCSTVTTAPEPASLLLLGTALFGAGWAIRRRRTAV